MIYFMKVLPPVRVQLGGEHRLGDLLEGSKGVVIEHPGNVHHVLLQLVKLPKHLPDAGPLLVANLSLVHMYLHTGDFLQHSFDLRPPVALTEVEDLVN